MGSILRAEEVELSGNPELRFYSVWSIPGRDSLDIAGVHWGLDRDTYTGTTGLNHGGEFKGIHWRRYDSIEAAKGAFLAEAGRFSLPANYSERLIGWIRRD